MADLIHLTNIIQGEVYRIKERRTLEQRPELFQEMIDYLTGQIAEITVEHLKAIEELKNET